MKKSTVSLFLLAALLVLGSILAAPPIASGQEEGIRQPRFRAGFYWEGFKIKDENLTNFFGHFQKNIPGFEVSFNAVDNIDVWTTFRVYSDEAKTTFTGLVDKFRLTMTSLGALYRPVRLSVFEPFVGAGLELYYYSEKIEGSTELASTDGSALGFHVQTGTYINITKFLAGKLYARLNSVNKTLAEATPDESTTLKLGGTEFGIALLVRF